MASNKGLGKGLGALLGDFSEEITEKSAYQMLPIYKVEPNPDQPRQDQRSGPADPDQGDAHLSGMEIFDDMFHFLPQFFY